MKRVIILTTFLSALPCPVAAHMTAGAGFSAQSLQTFGSQIVENAEVIFVGSPPPGVEAREVEAAIQAAVDSWNAVTCSSAVLSYAGRAESLSAIQAGQVPIVFTAPATELCFPDGFLGFTVLACADVPIPSVFLNTEDFDWSVYPQPFQSDTRLTVDLQSVITHELGHVLGLSHDEEDSLATMRASYLLDGGQSSLAANDKWALCALTGGGSDECRDDLDCPNYGTCAAGEEDLPKVCQEERGVTGDYCSPAFLICDPCVMTDSTGGVGYCSHACASTSECPDGYECADAGEGKRCELEFRALDDGGCSAAGTVSGAGGGAIAAGLATLTMLLTRRVR